MCLMRDGKQAGWNEEKTKESKSVAGRKDSEMVKGQQEVLCGGNVRREQRSQDLLETFGSWESKFLSCLLLVLRESLRRGSPRVGWASEATLSQVAAACPCFTAHCPLSPVSSFKRSKSDQVSSSLYLTPAPDFLSY